MLKVRYKTWYWGNYCLMPNKMELPKGFELYDEKSHGWENSEEFRLQGKKQTEIDREEHIKEFLSTSYYKNREGSENGTI